MCGYCGCLTAVDHHDHGHPHTYGDHSTIEIERSILAKNHDHARANRRNFAGLGIAAINFVSSPGSGKTAFLERTLKDLAGRYRMAVVVGDLATENDAIRLRAHGSPAIQISTGTTCHLDAHRVGHAVEELDLRALELLFIENVGNLVCPASFDLGEDMRVVLTSTTEGEDKPLKYPVIFEGASVVVISKMDLAQVVEFRRDEAIENIRTVAPRARIVEVSAKSGVGMEAWYSILKDLKQGKRRHHGHLAMHI